MEDGVNNCFFTYAYQLPSWITFSMGTCNHRIKTLPLSYVTPLCNLFESCITCNAHYFTIITTFHRYSLTCLPVEISSIPIKFNYYDRLNYRCRNVVSMLPLSDAAWVCCSDGNLVSASLMEHNTKIKMWVIRRIWLQ